MNRTLPLIVLAAVLLALMWRAPMLTFMLVASLAWAADAKAYASETALGWGMLVVGMVGVARLTHFIFSGIPLL